MASQTSDYSLFTPDFQKNTLIQSNYLAWSIIFSYIIFTKVVGPNIMKNRKPMELKGLLLLYNFSLVVSNIYICYTATEALIEVLPFRCEIRNSPLYKDRPRFYSLAWSVFIVKFVELLDTVFFILRKKFHQASFLHVFHHTIVCVLYWICLRYNLIGFYVLLIGSINTFIHVLLYSYYGLSALGPNVAKYLWWKKYLTTLQIMQFFVLMSYMAFSFLTGCEEFGTFERTVFVGLVSVTVLFLNFYYRTYTTKRKM